MKDNVFSFIIALVLGVMTLSSCDGDSYINTGAEPELVVEGWITAGGFPLVMLTTTVPVSDDKHTTDELEEHIRNWARVAISDGDKEVVLFGTPASRYMPPYIYTTTGIIGEEGKTYTLTVKDGDYYATATTTIPKGVELCDIVQEPSDASGSFRQLYAVFDDPEGENYYGLFYKIGEREVQYNMCNLGVFDDAGLSGQVKYPVYKTSYINTDVDAPEQFAVGDVVSVSLRTMDKASYDFWCNYRDAAAFSGNFFAPYTQNVRGNIIGGHGYWCGYNTSEKLLVVGE